MTIIMCRNVIIPSRSASDSSKNAQVDHLDDGQRHYKLMLNICSPKEKILQ